MLTVSREYRVTGCTHWLPEVPEGHRCRTLHGHNYRVMVTYIGRGPHGGVDNRGFVRDFAEIDSVVEPLLKLWDHKCLNDVVPNPTAELLAVWIAAGCGADRVRVYEEDGAWAEFTEGNHPLYI